MLPTAPTAPAAPLVGAAMLKFSVLLVGEHGRQVQLREDHVAFRLVVEQADAAADHRGIVDGVREAEARHEQVLRVVEAARRPEGNARVVAGREQLDAPALILGDLVAGDHQPVEPVADARHQQAVVLHPHRLRRVVAVRVEVHEVVALGVGRRRVLVADAGLDRQVLAHAPGVGHEPLVGGEPEEADRIRRRLVVGAEVAEQDVGQRVAGAVRVAGGVERDRPEVGAAAILVLAVARDGEAAADRVRAADPRQGVLESDVGGRRQQRERRTGDAGEARHLDVRDAAVDEAGRIEDLRVGEPEGVAQPEVALRLDALAVPRGTDLGFVDQRRPDHVGVAHLVATARP